jgi:hypothetical protein
LWALHVLSEIYATHPFFYGIIWSAESALLRAINRNVLWNQVSFMAVTWRFPIILPCHYSWIFHETDIIVCTFTSRYPSNSASLELVRVMGFIPNLDSSRVWYWLHNLHNIIRTKMSWIRHACGRKNENFNDYCFRKRIKLLSLQIYKQSWQT